MKLCIFFGICLLSNWFYLRLSFFFFFSFLKPWAENGLTNQFSSIHSLSHVWRFMTPWTAAHQASLCITNSLLKLMSIESVMLSHHVILCRPLLLLHLSFPSIRVFSGEWVLHIRWPKCMSFGFSISASNDIQDWYHSWLSGFTFLQSKELSKGKKERKKSRKQNSCRLFVAEHDTPSVTLAQKCSCGEGMEKAGTSYTVGEKVNWCSHYEEQYGDSLKN